MKTELHDMFVHIMSLLRTFLLTCSHISIHSCSYRTAHSLCSQTDFHGILCKRLQVFVSHIMRQMIKYNLFVNFIYLQYVCPLSSTSKWLSIYNNPKRNIDYFIFKEKFMCAFKQVKRIKNCCNWYSRNLKKGVFFRNIQLFEGFDIAGTHVTHSSNNYQSYVVAGTKNLHQKINKHLTFSASTIKYQATDRVHLLCRTWSMKNRA